LDGLKVNPNYKKRSVVPRYVWLTGGVGSYTNEKSAEFIAKKNAGVEGLYYDSVSRVEKTPFTICTKDEFLRHAQGNKLYMYGTTDFGKKGDIISGCISGISMPDWGIVSYGMSHKISTDRVKRSVLKEMCYEYEIDRGEILPNPTERTEHVSCDEEKSYCIVVAAMIIE
tara:strand:- start:9088 stop:9597 length:510 start_codon:yes stop_codon:yes gene_type:complete